MRLSKTLKKIHSGNCVRICGLGHYLPFFVRYAAHFGFDTIWLDLEHRAMTDREVQAILALCHQYDIDCMVRSPTREHTKLYRYLEDGAAGLMMPLVADAADAQFIVNCTKFPPMGNRGIDGAGIDGDFGLAVWNEGSSYTDDANRETFIVIQIETPQALANADAIAAVDGVDALFVGPADLGLRLAQQTDGLDLETAITQVAAAAKRHGKAWGMPAGPADILAKRHSQGAQLLVSGGDFALMGVLEEGSKAFDEALKE